MILFGLDPFAARVARSLVADTASSSPRAVVCEPTGDNTVADLRRCVSGLMEAKRALGEPFEPHLGLLATASAPECAATLQALRDSCAMLQTLSGGNQSVALVVLVSSPIAEDAARCADLRFFVALEELVGELPFLDTVFVNQLVREDDPSGDDPVSDELRTLLAGELLDPDMRPVIAGLGHAAVDWRTRVAGRKACYSTLGTYRLEYRPNDALTYLSGRLEHELLEHGLAAPGRVDGHARSVIQARVDEIASGWLAAIAKRLPPTPTVNLSGVADAADGEEFDRLLSALPAEIERGFATLGPQLGLGELSDGWTKRALLDFLPLVPAHLAGALAFMDAMVGHRIAGDAGRLSGVVAMRKALCRDAFDRSASDVGKRLLRSVDVATAPGEEWPRDMPLDWLVKSAEAVAQVASAKRPSAAGPARLLVALLQRVVQWSEDGDGEESPAMAIVEDVAGLYLREAREMLVGLTANRQRRADVERALDALSGSYGLMARTLTRRGGFRTELAALNEQRARLDQQQTVLASVFSQLSDLLDAVLNGIVLPQMLRRRIDTCVRRDAERSAEELRAFMDAVAAGVQACWSRGVAAGQEGRTTVGSRLLSSERLNALYSSTLEKGHIGFPQAVDDVLAFAPRAAASANGRGGSYRDCSGLADHYRRGPRSLLDRIEDYANQHCAWVLGLDALDVIECQGRDIGARFLMEVSEHAQRFLELSPGLLPRARDEGRPQVIFVVRTASDVAKRLAANYSGPFSPNPRFVDSGDPHTIQVTALVCGFPAFLIHGLHEGRRVALVGGRDEGSDLWPC